MPRVRGLRTIKKEILKLIETFVEKSDDLEMVRTNIVPNLLEAVLIDYNRNVPGARDAEVLKVMSVIITKLSVRWTPYRSKYSVVHTLLVLASLSWRYFQPLLTLNIGPHGRSSPKHYVKCFRMHFGNDQQGLLRIPRTSCWILQPPPSNQSSLLPRTPQTRQPTIQICHRFLHVG